MNNGTKLRDCIIGWLSSVTEDCSRHLGNLTLAIIFAVRWPVSGCWERSSVLGSGMKLEFELDKA